MTESVSAAISIQGQTLRFAELEHRDDGYVLRRLGGETASFDLAQALLRGEGDAQKAGELGRIVGEGLEGTAARDLRVAIHPPDGYSFFTPISSDVPVRDRKRQLLQQAALVTGVRSSKELTMTSDTVRTTQDSEGEPFMWVHVLAVPDVVDELMAELVSALPVRDYEWVVSSEAAARVTSRIERTGGSATEALRPYTLAVGQYPSHTEYALSRNREWYHAHYAEEAESPENRAYFAVGFMNRVDVPLNAVGRLYVYGVDVDLTDYVSLESIFGREPEVLDPFRVVRHQLTSLPDDPGAYAPNLVPVRSLPSRGHPWYFGMAPPVSVTVFSHTNAFPHEDHCRPAWRARPQVATRPRNASIDGTGSRVAF